MPFKVFTTENGARKNEPGDNRVTCGLRGMGDPARSSTSGLDDSFMQQEASLFFLLFYLYRWRSAHPSENCILTRPTGEGKYPKLKLHCNTNLTPWLMEPGGSMPHSQGHSNNPYPEPNQPNSPH